MVRELCVGYEFSVDGRASDMALFCCDHVNCGYRLGITRALLC